MKNLDLLVPVQPTPTGDRWLWATITGVNPLRIRLDGDEAALEATPDILYSAPAVGERVWVQFTGHRIIVHSSAGLGANASPTLRVGDGEVLATYEASSANLAGYLIIDTNIGFTDTMCRIRVEGWHYFGANNGGIADRDGNIIDLTFTLYPFNAGTVHQADFVNNGTMRFSDVHILKRTSTGKISIAIRPDTTSNQWHYPKLWVSGTFGGVAPTNPMLKGWEIARSAALTGYTTLITHDDGPIHMRASLHTAEVVGTGGWFTLINWTVSDTDPFITYSGTSTWTITKPGTYLVNATVAFQNQSSSNGVRALRINHVGVGTQDMTYAAPIAAVGDYATARTSTALRLLAGAQLQVQVLHNAGGNVSINPGTSTQFSITRLGSR